MRKGVLALAILLAGAYSGTAFAHGAGVEGLDLSDLQDLATDRAAETPVSEKKARKAWVKLASTLAKEGKKGLADDAKKLSVVLKLVEGPFASDLELAEALDEAVAALDGTLSGLPGESEKWIDHVESEKDRAAVAKLSIAARGHHLEGRTLGNGGDGKGRLASFRKSALGFLKTWGRADKAIDRQGGPLPVEVAAEAGKIYTVVGTGTGGFNGDGREARRSSLYWVEEVKFGPDGRLYILDWNNHMVRRLEADGTVSRLFGKGVPGDSEGTPEDTELNHPSSIDFGPDGRIFVGAWHNHKVKVYDPNGGTPTVYTIAGTIQGNSGDGASAAQAKFNLLPGVLLLPPEHPFGGGDLLCTDAGNQCVRIVKLASDPLTDTNVAGVSVPTGKVERFWGTGVQGHDGNGGQASAARLGFSKAQNAESDGRMTMDAAGNVFLVNGVENVIRRIALDGTITIVAGTGEAGYSGDGGPATSAKLNFPSDVAVAPDGTLFISDQLNNVVRKVTPGGTISTFVGDGTGASGYSGDGGAPGAARLHRPTGLELDAEGNLWICDKENSVIRVVTSATTSLMVPREPFVLPVPTFGAPPEKGLPGTIDTFAGTGIAAFTGDGKPARETDFYWPQDVTVEPSSGLLSIVDWNNHRIRRVEDDGTVKTILGIGELGDTNGPALEVRLNHPTDIAFNPVDGNLYMATWHTDKVKMLDGSTNMLSAVNKADGRRFFSGDEGNVNMAELNLPSSVKFTSTGVMYIADAGNRRVRRVDPETRIITTIAGTGNAGFSGDDGDAKLAMFNLPVGQSAQPAGRICIDPTDTWLYVADTDNHRVRRIHLGTNVITTVAGNGTPGFTGDGAAATAASLYSPVDVDCDAQGNLYIADRDNHAVRRVDKVTGIITTVAGTGAQGYAGDGGPGTGATLNFPCGVFVDRSTGRLYIADTFNGVVRVVWE